MLNWIKWDLLEIPGDLKDVFRSWWNMHTDLKEAPPSTRKILTGFVTILDRDNHVVGCFSPDLYEMAKMGFLRCQLERNETAAERSKKKPPYISLNKADGSEKTPFELALLPVLYDDKDLKSERRITKIVQDEFYNLKKKGIPLPPLEFKYQIASDYLRNLEEAKGLKPGIPRDFDVNLQNPADETSFKERMFHYLAQRGAMLLTIAACLLIIPGTTALYVPLALLGVMLAQWCGKEFFTYDLVETSMRDVNSRVYSKGEKISAKKTLKTTLLMGALLIAAAGVGVGAWYEMMSIAFPAVQSVVLAKLIAGAHYFLAGFVTFAAAAGTFIGGTVSQRFFWGLGIKYKQIDFPEDSKDKPVAAMSERQALTPEQTKDKLLQWQYKALHKVPDLDDAAVARVRQAFADLAQTLSVDLNDAPVAVAAPAAVAPAPTLLAVPTPGEASGEAAAARPLLKATA